MDTWRVIYTTKSGQTIRDTEVCITERRAEDLAADFRDNDFITDAWTEKNDS